MAVTAQISGTTDPFWHLIALFSFVGSFPVLWVGLRDGFTSALTACGIAVGFVLTAKLLGAPYNLLSFLTQVLMILTLVRFSLLSRTTETGTVEWYPGGQVLSYLIGIAALAVFAQLAMESGPIYPDETLRAIAKEFAASSAIEEQMYETLKLVISFYPSIAAIITLIFVVANSGLAQKLLESKQQNIRPAGTYRIISLPGFYLWFVAGAAALTIFGVGGSLGPNILMVLCIGFFLVGLNLVHEYNRLYNFGTITLVVFYVVMILFGWLAVLVSLIGLFEPWLRSHPEASKNLKG